MNGGIKISLVAALLTAGCAATPNGVQVRPIADPMSKLRPGGDRLADAKGQLAIGNVGLALEAFRTVARLYPDNAEAYVGMALCYEQMRRFDLAQSKYEAALALEPRDPELLGRLAVALDQQGKADQAAGVRGEIAAMRSASTVLDNAQVDPTPAVASLAPAQTVTVALPKPTVVAAPAPVQAPAPAPAAPSSNTQYVLAEPVGRLTAAQLASQSKLNIAAAGTVKTLSAEPLRAAAPFIVQPAPVQVVAAVPVAPAPNPQLVFADPVSKLLPAKLASESRPTLAADGPAVLAAAPIRASAPFIVQPVIKAPAAAPTPTPAMFRPAAPTVTPHLERMSLGEVALLTGSGPVWRPQVVAASPQKVSVRWVALNNASRPNIRLFNAARTQGLAARNRDYLLNRGWRKIEIADADSIRDRSVVFYPAARPQLGRSLAAQFGFRAQPTTTSEVFLVYLGRDAAGMRVAALRG